MLKTLITTACALAILSGSIWLLLSAISILLTVTMPSILIFLGILTLLVVVLHGCSI